MKDIGRVVLLISKRTELPLFFLLIVMVGQSSAANDWYYGQVTNVTTLSNDGSFMVYLDNASIKNTCAYDRVNFRVRDMGSERTKAALAMALLAYSTGKQYGIVVDLPAVGLACYASKTTAQGAAIQD